MNKNSISFLIIFSMLQSQTKLKANVDLEYAKKITRHYSKQILKLESESEPKVKEALNEIYRIIKTINIEKFDSANYNYIKKNIPLAPPSNKNKLKIMGKVYKIWKFIHENKIFIKNNSQTSGFILNKYLKINHTARDEDLENEENYTGIHKAYEKMFLNQIKKIFQQIKNDNENYTDKKTTINYNTKILIMLLKNNDIKTLLQDSNTNTTEIGNLLLSEIKRILIEFKDSDLSNVKQILFFLKGKIFSKEIKKASKKFIKKINIRMQNNLEMEEN